MVGSFLQMDSYMKHEYEQRKADAVVKAEAGGLELCSPASSACGRKHIWMLFTRQGVWNKGVCGRVLSSPLVDFLCFYLKLLGWVAECGPRG